MSHLDSLYNVRLLSDPTQDYCDKISWMNLMCQYTSIENLFQRAINALQSVSYIFHYLYHIICAAEHYTFYKEK